MINKISNNESKNSKSKLIPAVMSLMLMIQTQTLNALEPSQDFYNNETSKLNGYNNNEIQKLELKKKILELELQIQKLKSGNNQNQNNIEYGKNNIDFQIVGGTITVKTLQIKWKGGLKFSKGKTRDIPYEITDEQINRVKGTNNKYEILLKRENSNRIYKFYIKYNGGYSIKLYDQYGRYIGRQIIETKQKTIVQGNNFRKEIYKTPGKLTIDTKREKIKLDIMFNN